MRSVLLKKMIFGYFIFLVVMYLIGVIFSYKTYFSFTDYLSTFEKLYDLISPIILYLFLTKKEILWWKVMFGYIFARELAGFVSKSIQHNFQNVSVDLLFLVITVTMFFYIREDFISKKNK